MLSEINLLPEKEKRSILFVVLLTIILAVGVIGGLLLSFHYQFLVKQKSIKQSEINVIAKQIDLETQKLQEVSAKFNVSHYQSIVKTVRQLPLQTVAILDDTAAVLPVSGFFNTYAYLDTGVISLSVQFSSLNDTANYLHQLTYADWVKQAEIRSITRKEENGVFLYQAVFHIDLDRAAFLHSEGEEVN